MTKRSEHQTYGIGPLSDDDVDGLVDAMERCPTLIDDGIRASIVKRLPGGIGQRVRSHRSLRVYLTYLVETCAQYAGGLEALRDAVHEEEGESYAMGEFAAVFDALRAGLYAGRTGTAMGPRGDGELARERRDGVGGRTPERSHANGVDDSHSADAWRKRRARLQRKLADRKARRARLAAIDEDTTALDQEIRATQAVLHRGGYLAVGDAFGDGWILAESLGRGGFAEVWRATRSVTGEQVAIKVLYPWMARDEVTRERFVRGVQQMVELDQPGVIDVLEASGEFDGFHYAILELAEGGDLEKAVLGGRCGGSEDLALIVQVAETLAAAHRAGLVHRDVKPSNILLTATGEPCLTDFDLVEVSDMSYRLTRTGAMGSFLYEAPELLDKPHEADARADVYGLGMTTVFLLYRDNLPHRVLGPGVVSFIDELSCRPTVAEVLRTATDADREMRYRDAGAFAEALTAALASTETTPMVHLDGGRIVMGSSDRDDMAFDDEKPAHEVEVGALWCMRYPVTRRLWWLVMGADHDWLPDGPADNRPVTNVSWYQAVRFCNALSSYDGVTPCYQITGDEAAPTVTWHREAGGYRLPTEAEWEYACRAGTTTRWWFGDNEDLLSEYAWHNKNTGSLQPVGKKPPNPWGFYDMYGNVWEWCWDWFGRYPGSMEGGRRINPSGPSEAEAPEVNTYNAEGYRSTAKSRTLRGGAFGDWARDLRSAIRNWGAPEFRFRDGGFRCVRGGYTQYLAG